VWSDGVAVPATLNAKRRNGDTSSTIAASASTFCPAGISANAAPTATDNATVVEALMKAQLVRMALTGTATTKA
jgi:hypothetical protein